MFLLCKGNSPNNLLLLARIHAVSSVSLCLVSILVSSSQDLELGAALARVTLRIRSCSTSTGWIRDALAKQKLCDQVQEWMSFLLSLSAVEKFCLCPSKAVHGA